MSAIIYNFRLWNIGRYIYVLKDIFHSCFVVDRTLLNLRRILK